MNIQCQFCKKLYRHKRSLDYHLKSVHSYTPQVAGNLICPINNCGIKTLRYDDLRKHLDGTHDFICEREEFIFESLRDFTTWKKQEEHYERMSYVKIDHTSPLGPKEKVYYRCHRSGFYQPKNGMRTRQSKLQGSKKMNKSCPSTLEVTIGKKKIHVLKWKTHCGHPVNVVANKGFKRLHVKTKQDVRLYRRDFDLCLQEPVFEPLAGIQNWVEEAFKRAQDNPVLYYKAHMECNSTLNMNDFLLIIMTKFQKQFLLKLNTGKLSICIDSTPALVNSAFKLTTVLAVDELGCGYPVAFCLGNRMDAVVSTLLFTMIKENVGIIDAYVFISDDTPVFYNIWKCVMGTSNHRLLCPWNVDSNWRKRLSKLEVPKERRSAIYKTLQELFLEGSNDKFFTLQSNLLEELLANEETKAFGAYYNKHYAKRVAWWSYRNRQLLSLDTNMYLEAMHKTLRLVYLDSNRYDRTDLLINVLLKIANDKIFDQLIRLSDETLSSLVREIDRSHITSRRITGKMISVVDDSTWRVTSARDADLRFVVQLLEDPCPVAECMLKCKTCSICVHLFNCSCYDHLFNYNICEHIHACATSLNQEYFLSENPALASKTSIDEKKALDVANSKADTSTVGKEVNCLIRYKLNAVIRYVSKAKLNRTASDRLNTVLDNCLLFCKDGKNYENSALPDAFSSQNSKTWKTANINNNNSIKDQKKFVPTTRMVTKADLCKAETFDVQEYIKMLS